MWLFLSLIFHWRFPPAFCIFECEARKDFVFAYGLHYFLFVSIISQFIFVINLVWCLFTLYTFFVTDGKRAPTAIGRGSSPRSRTGCDIFNCTAVWAAISCGERAIVATQLSILCSHTGCDATAARGHRWQPHFNLMQSHRPRLGIFSISLRFQSYAVTQTASLDDDIITDEIYSFNLMQSRRLLHSPSKKRLLSARFQSYAVTRAATIFTEFIRWDILISILCSPHGLLHSADVLPLPVGPFQSYAAA